MKKLIVVAIIGIVVFFAVGKIQNKAQKVADNHYSVVDSFIELELGK